MMLLILQASCCAILVKSLRHRPVIVVVFAFPRVMIGAHWLTDIAVGSLTAVLIGLPWVLMTPLSDRVIGIFDRYLPGKFKQVRNK